MAKEHILIYRYLIFQLCSILCICNTYRMWEPPKQTRTDLWCKECCYEPSVCRTGRSDTNDCCICLAIPDWEINRSKAMNLSLEYLDRRGKAIVLGYEQSNLTILNHTDGYLSRLPVNLCDFQSSLKLIDLKGNNILDIGNISCLLNLDTLLLNYNKITSIRNETFKELVMLRVIDLSNNKIIHMETGIFNNIKQGILKADLSGNNLKTIDVSNFIIEKPFCEVSYKNNSITKIVNELNWKIDINKEYGKGGMVLLAENDFRSAIDFRELGVDDLTQLSKLVYFGFDVRGAKWNCDCKMVPFLQLAEDFINKIWRDYFNVLCYEPEQLKNQSIGKLVSNKQLDKFICDYSNTSICPKNCYCFEQTRNNRTIVNCTSSFVRVMPEKLPKGTNLELYFEHNLLTELGNMEYLQRSSYLNFTNNSLTELKELNLSSVKFMNFSNNKIKKIHKSFKTMNPCDIELGHVTLDCVCEDFWLKDWISIKKPCKYETVNNITCKISNRGFFPVNEITEDLLDCASSNDVGWIISTIACLVMSITLLFASLYHYFYVEIYLIRRKLFDTKGPDEYPLLKYDAYISVNDDECELRTWTHEVMTKNLEEGGYKIFLPFRDVQIGRFREESIQEKISECKNYVFLLSETSNVWTSLEWKYAWNQYRSIKSRNIIIINFDQLETREIIQREIKAFSRLCWTIDFTNIHSKTLLKIRKALGTPLIRNRVGMKNANVRFRPKFNNSVV